MRKFIINAGKQTITDEDFSYIEAKFNITFPKEFKNFYLENSGCKNYLCTFGESEEYELSRFLKLTGQNSVEDIKDSENEDGFISDRMIPFAMDRGGDYYYLNAIDKAVYLIRGEEIEEPILIANSFNDFLEILDNSEMR